MLEKLDTLIAFATIMLGISLLITILNQMIASLLGHRATYLKDGIKDLLETLDPTLGGDVENIANNVLIHKLASDSIFAHQSWAPTRWKLASAIRPEELAKLLKLVSDKQPYQKKIEAILDEVNPTVAREAKLIANTVNSVAPNVTASADELIKQISDKATKAVGRLEGAFNSTMDRVRQRFTLQMRIWTIVFSLIFAVIYHLDAARLYTQISTDPVLRASVTAVSDDLMKKYVDVQPPAAGQPEMTQQELETKTKKLKDAYRGVQADLTETKLQLLEVPHPWWPGLHVFCTLAAWGKLFRILATAGLLSLGAPFWYNTLKSLVNLRSQVAEQQQKEAKA
jgi:hypothetical protein